MSWAESHDSVVGTPAFDHDSTGGSGASEYIDLSDSESPLFVGRAVAALAADPDVTRHTGQVVRTAGLAEEYAFTDPG